MGKESRGGRRRGRSSSAFPPLQSQSWQRRKVQELPKAPALRAEPQKALPPPQRAPAPAACQGTQLDHSFSACTAKMVTRMPGTLQGEQPAGAQLPRGQGRGTQEGRQRGGGLPCAPRAPQTAPKGAKTHQPPAAVSRASAAAEAPAPCAGTARVRCSRRVGMSSAHPLPPFPSPRWGSGRDGCSLITH